MKSEYTRGSDRPSSRTRRLSTSSTVVLLLMVQVDTRPSGCRTRISKLLRCAISSVHSMCESMGLRAGGGERGSAGRGATGTGQPPAPARDAPRLPQLDHAVERKIDRLRQLLGGRVRLQQRQRDGQARGAVFGLAVQREDDREDDEQLRADRASDAARGPAEQAGTRLGEQLVVVAALEQAAQDLQDDLPTDALAARALQLRRRG